MSRIVFVGAYAYAREVLWYLALTHRPVAIVTEPDEGQPRWQRLDDIARGMGIPVIGLGEVADHRPDLIIVAGWRRLIPRWALDLCPVVGFHSAKLPEYPGRAPVPWALLRGDAETANTLLYLADGVDTGDIIGERIIPIGPDDTPDTLYRTMERTSISLLREHLAGILDGTAPRRPQDMTRRGPLTTADGWRRWEERA